MKREAIRDGARDALYADIRLRRSLKVDAIVSLHYYEYASGFCGVEESHDFWEMVYADGGTIICCANGEHIRLAQGQAILHPPWEPHNVLAMGTDSSTCIFSFSCERLPPELFRGRVVSLCQAERDIVGMIYQEGRALFEGPYNQIYQPRLMKRSDAPYGAEQMVRNLLEILLVMLSRGQMEKKPPGEPLQREIVRRDQHNEVRITDNIVALLRANLHGQLSMQDICRATAFSASHIQCVFKKQTGYSVMRYYNKLKIDQAKRMIGEGQYTFTQIGELLGFSSIHYFSHVFRAFVKMSPTEYEKSVRMSALL